MGGCVTDRRQDAGAAAPSGGLGDNAGAERTPALCQRTRPRADNVPSRGTWRGSLTATQEGVSGLVPGTAPQITL